MTLLADSLAGLPLGQTNNASGSVNLRNEAHVVLGALYDLNDAELAAILAMARQYPPKHRATYLKAMTGKSRLAAVRAKCLDCAGFSHRSVRECVNTECSLYPYRMMRKDPNADDLSSPPPRQVPIEDSVRLAGIDYAAEELANRQGPEEIDRGIPDEEYTPSLISAAIPSDREPEQEARSEEITT